MAYKTHIAPQAATAAAAALLSPPPKWHVLCRVGR